VYHSHDGLHLDLLRHHTQRNVSHLSVDAIEQPPVACQASFTPQAELLPPPSLDAGAVMEVFRRLLLQGLQQAKRLSGSFMHNRPTGRVSAGDDFFLRPRMECPIDQA
jgi:hypothetical protein